MTIAILAMYIYAAFLKEDSIPRWILVMDVASLDDYMKNPNYSMKCLEENAVNCEVQFKPNPFVNTPIIFI